MIKKKRTKDTIIDEIADIMNLTRSLSFFVNFKTWKKDQLEVVLKMGIDFHKKHKRMPNKKEMLKIIDDAGYNVADFWKKYPKNFKWVKKDDKIKCLKCKSENIVSHTDKNLRKEQKLVWQCFDCNHYWKTDWDT